MSQKGSITKAKTSMNKSGETFQPMFGHHPIPMWIHERETLAFLEVNGAAIKQLGYKRSEFLKMTLDDIFSPHETPNLFADLKQARRAGRHPNEWHLRRKDGKLIPVEIASQAVEYHGRKAVLVTAWEVAGHEQALYESQSFNQKILEMTPSIVYIFDLDKQQEVFVNRPLADVLGYTPAQAAPVGSVFFPADVHPDDAHILREKLAWAAAARDGDIGSREYRVRHANGEWRWIGVREIVFSRGSEGMPNQIMGTARDITERMQFEDTLKRSEKKYRLLHESMLDGFVSVDLNGKILECNEIYGNMLGYSKAELAQLTYMDITPEKWHMLERGIVENQILKRGYSDVYEKEYRRKNGTIFPVELRTVLLRDKRGKPAGTWAIVRDITGRKQAEESLRESEEKFRTLTALAPIGIYLTDADGDCLYANPAWCQMAGLSLEDALGQGWVKGLHPDDRELVIAHWQQMVASQSQWRLEYRFQTQEGKDTLVYGLAAPQYDASGKIIRYIGINLDITERKRAEGLLMESEWRNRIVSELTTDYIFVVDVDPGGILKLRWASDSMFRMTGRTIEDAGTSDMWGRIFHPDDAARFFGFMNQILSTAKSGELECRTLHKQGEKRWVRIYARPQLGEANKVTTVVGAVQDITKRKRAEMERQALLEIMQGLVSTNNMREFLELIRQSINKVTPAENYSVVLYNKETGLFEEVYAIDKYDAPTPPSKLEKSITAYVFHTAKSLLLDQENFDELSARGEVELVGTSSACWLGAPLQTPAETLGVITIQDYENPTCYSGQDKEFLTFIGVQVALAVERKYAEEKLTETKESLRLSNIGLQQALEREQRVSRTDSLTDANNRRYFFEIASHEFVVAKRYGKPLSMIMFDIDHFKQFNDLYGHQAGDEILKNIVQIAKQQLREADIFARYGGEEFVVLLPNSNAQESAIVAGRILESVAAHQMDAHGNKVSITISVGLTECLASTDTLDQLIQQADRAMYAAKDAGRNCVYTNFDSTTNDLTV